MHAANLVSPPRRPLISTQLADSAWPTPYRWQNAAVSARSGSISATATWPARPSSPASAAATAGASRSGRSSAGTATSSPMLYPHPVILPPCPPPPARSDAAAPAEPVARLQQAMAAGTLTSAALTARCLDRIAALNPRLRAVITVSPEAAAEAAARDQQRSPGSGPLHGIPVLIKDNIAVAGLPATAGSPALLGAETGDSFLVGRLRAAGAVILGKANLSEWANFRSPRSSSGWSTLGGQAANPHALDRNPSGSSSGSGVAVAAGLAPLAVGTETDGSIVCPASACGVVGIKPTLGLVSRHGIVPISAAQDTAGPMARTVADAAALLSVLAGADAADPATAGAAGQPADYTAFLDPGALQRRPARRVAGRLRRGRPGHPGRAGRRRRRCSASTGATVLDPVRPARRGRPGGARVRRAAARVQARPQPLPARPARPAAALPGRAHRLQHAQRRPRCWCTSARNCSSRPRRPAGIRPTRPRGPPGPRPGRGPGRRWTARWPRTGWTRSSRSPPTRPG